MQFRHTCKDSSLSGGQLRDCLLRVRGDSATKQPNCWPTLFFSYFRNAVSSPRGILKQPTGNIGSALHRRYRRPNRTNLTQTLFVFTFCLIFDILRILFVQHFFLTWRVARDMLCNTQGIAVGTMKFSTAILSSILGLSALNVSRRKSRK